ncbi:MAG: cyclic nucleotide-binding/CBS domain-containing protein [Alphaproteobacteria bacterium]
MLVTELPSLKGQVLSHAMPSMTVLDASRQMTEAGIGCLPVVDAAGHLVGIVTERDLLNKVISLGKKPGETTVSDVMTAEPKTVTHDTDVSEAAELMGDGNFRHLPVVDADDKVVGMISIRDIASFSLAEATTMSLKVNAARARRFYQVFIVVGGLILYTLIILGFIFFGERLGLM